MFSFAILIGVYSYLLFSFGLFGLFIKPVILVIDLFFVFFCLWYFRAIIFSRRWFDSLIQFYFYLLHDTFSSLLISLLVLQSLINIIGAFGPELGFDALWYHLTLPKIFLQDGSIHHISGGLFYYSDMPKLMEMVYAGSLSFGNEIFAKLIHFGFGILTLFVLYKISRMFFPRRISLLVVTIFSSNLVFDWESITAYVDLGLTFFSTLALWCFLLWQEHYARKWLLLSAVMVGLCTCVKTLGLGLLGIFIPLLFFLALTRKRSWSFIWIDAFIFLSISFLIPFPWFFYSFLQTGNFFYPFFSSFYHVPFDFSLLSPFHFLRDMWSIFTRSSDPISPIYILFFPLIIYQLFFLQVFLSKYQFSFLGFMRHSLRRKHSSSRIFTEGTRFGFFFLFVYCSLSLMVWYVIPRTGGGRFMLPFLPGLSLLIGYVLSFPYPKRFLQSLWLLIIFIAIVSIGYRAIANRLYLPVIFGQEGKGEFLSKRLNFSYGDFYDVDGYFSTHLTANDRVLLYGMHNLYYVDFPFVDSSWVQPGDRFDYILVQHGELPKRFHFFREIYRNSLTHVVLYSYGGKLWIY